MYKFLYLFLFPFLTSSTSHAQLVNQLIEFDYYTSITDNDFQNYFDQGTGLTQLQTNGITGGCLETPTTISWGNDNAVYCTRFKGVIGVSYVTGICFKYDTTQLNNINFDRATSIWMKPYTDPNHYLIASVLDTRRIQIVSYSVAGTSGVMQLQQGHWYVLLMVANFTGGAFNDEINVTAQVNDLGLTGTDPPIPTGYTDAMFLDTILIADTSIEVSITGTSWGGALFLDNFRFEGMKSYDNCISTEIENELEKNEISIFVEDNILAIFSKEEMLDANAIIYNITGQHLLSTGIYSTISRIDVAELLGGIYFLSVESEKGRTVKKFTISK